MTSCSYLPVTPGKPRQVRMLGMSNSEVIIGLTLPVYNPNKRPITIRKMNLAVYHQSELLGEIRDLPVTRLNAQDTTEVMVRAYLQFGDLLTGGLSLLRLYSSSQTEVVLKGSAVVTTGIIRKRLSIDETFRFKLYGKE